MDRVYHLHSVQNLYTAVEVLALRSTRWAVNELKPVKQLRE